MVEVTLLGCGGGMPLPTRYLSAVLLQYKGRKSIWPWREISILLWFISDLG